MNVEQLELQKKVELQLLCHAMVDPETFEEVSSKYTFNLGAYQQAMPKIGKCIEANGICNVELLKLSGFNSVELEPLLHPHKLGNIENNIRVAKTSAGRIGLAQVLKMGADKMEDYSKGIDVLLDEILDEVEFLSRTNTPKPLFELTPLSKAVATDTEWIGTNWLPIPKRAVTLITAKGGTGKSFVVLQILIKYLSEHQDKKAFAWLSEDPIGVTLVRARNICTDIGISLDILDRLMVVGSENEVPHLYNSKGVTNAFIQTKRLLKDYELVVIDPLIAFYGEDENNNSHARAFMNVFTAWVNREDKAVILIHHSKKGDEDQGARGAGAFVDAARLTYTLSRFHNKKEAEDQNLFITVGKDNYNAKQHLGHNTVQRRVFPLKLTITDNSESKNKRSLG